MMRSIIKAESLPFRLVRGILIALFWLAIWSVLAMAVGQEILVPTPIAVFQTLQSLVITLPFWQAVGLSLLRIGTGFIGAVLCGTLLGVLTVRFPVVRLLLSPVLHCVRAAPVASFIILALVWIRTGMVPVFISFLMVLPMIWLSVEEGIRQTDPLLLEVASVYRFGTWKTVTRVYLPSVLPFFLSACVSGLGFAWKSGVAAEVICRPDFSIGRQLQQAKIYLETPEVFAWTAVVILLSIALEKALLWLVSATSMRRERRTCRDSV